MDTTSRSADRMKSVLKAMEASIVSARQKRLAAGGSPPSNLPAPASNSPMHRAPHAPYNPVPPAAFTPSAADTMLIGRPAGDTSNGMRLKAKPKRSVPAPGTMTSFPGPGTAQPRRANELSGDDDQRYHAQAG